MLATVRREASESELAARVLSQQLSVPDVDVPGEEALALGLSVGDAEGETVCAGAALNVLSRSRKRARSTLQNSCWHGGESRGQREGSNGRSGVRAGLI